MKPSDLAVSREVLFAPMSQRPESTELPEQFTEAATLYETLTQEWIDDVSQTAVVNRKSGFQLPTMLLFLFAYFTSGTTSIKKLCDTLRRRSNRLLAEFAGLEKFPSQSSVSRFLKRVSQERLEQLVCWLLVTSHSRTRALLRHPLCGCLDTFGGVWQLFDLDPSVTGLRQRHLPDDPSLPPAIRDSNDFAAPGYPGRKRADVIVRRTLLQHVGSSLWVGSWIRQGGGGTRETFEAAVGAVLECCRFADFDPGRAIVRVDGEGGGVPYLTAYQDAGLRYLVRCTHYSLLDELDLDRLSVEGAWFEVDTGAERLAIELGECLLAAGNATTTADGEPYDPVLSRVVLTRTPVCEGESGAGKLIDGYRYELFATNLEPADWPAAEVVQAYSHRSAIENRLALEDQDIGLDKVFSFDLAGQALVTVLGLLVWNLRILCGFALAANELDAEGVPRQNARDAHAMSPRCDDQVVESVEVEEAPLRDAPENDASLDERRTEIERAIHHEVAQRLAPEKLPPTMSWSDNGLLCANDARLEIVATRTVDGYDYASLLAPLRTCGDCKSRLDCSRSTKSEFRKEVAIPIPDAARLRDLLKQRKALAITMERVRPPAPAATTARTRRPTTRDPVEAPDGGPFRIALGMLNPRALVHRFAEAVTDTVLHVRPSPQPCSRPRRRFSYHDAHDRQRRRKTWDERLAYNRRTAGPRVTVFSGPLAGDVMRLQAYNREAALCARTGVDLV